MLIILRLAGATELALVCLEGLVPGSHIALPLGGNHLAQVGAVFGIAFVAKETLDALTYAVRIALTWWRRRK